MRLNRTSARAYALVSVLALALGASAQAKTAPSGKLAAITIDNFGQINDNYYRGAQPQGRDYSDLASIGIKTVIDLTEDGDANEAGMVKEAGMTFYRIPMTTHSRPVSDAVEQFLRVVNDPANQPIYVHCQGGHHRTGIMTAVYRMTQDSWSADRAFQEMQQYGFGPAFLHATLKDFVYDYYAHLDRANLNAQRDVVSTKAAN